MIFGAERFSVQIFNIFVAQGADLVHTKEKVTNFNLHLRTVVKRYYHPYMHVVRTDRPVRNRLRDGQVRLKIPEQLQLAVGENTAGYNQESPDKSLDDAAHVL